MTMFAMVDMAKSFQFQSLGKVPAGSTLILDKLKFPYNTKLKEACVPKTSSDQLF